MKKEEKVELKPVEKQMEHFGHETTTPKTPEEKEEQLEPEEKLEKTPLSLKEQESEQIIDQIYEVINLHFSSQRLPQELGKYQNANETVDLILDVLKLWGILE